MLDPMMFPRMSPTDCLRAAAMHVESSGSDDLEDVVAQLIRTWTDRVREGLESYHPADEAHRLGSDGQIEEVVRLREGVVLVQTLGTGDQMTLYSEALDIFPDRQYAESDQDVMIDSAMSRFYSAGIKSDLKAGSMSLFASETEPVRTILQP